MTRFDRVEPRLAELITELAAPSLPDYTDDVLARALPEAGGPRQHVVCVIGQARSGELGDELGKPLARLDRSASCQLPSRELGRFGRRLGIEREPHRRERPVQP